MHAGLCLCIMIQNYDPESGMASFGARQEDRIAHRGEDGLYRCDLGAACLRCGREWEGRVWVRDTLRPLSACAESRPHIGYIRHAANRATGQHGQHASVNRACLRLWRVRALLQSARAESWKSWGGLGAAARSLAHLCAGYSRHRRTPKQLAEMWETGAQAAEYAEAVDRVRRLLHIPQRACGRMDACRLRVVPWACSLAAEIGCRCGPGLEMLIDTGARACVHAKAWRRGPAARAHAHV